MFNGESLAAERLNLARTFHYLVNVPEIHFVRVINLLSCGDGLVPSDWVVELSSRMLARSVLLHN